MKATLALLVLSLAAAHASAKLPPPSDEAKAKAAETAAKTAWGDKVAAYQLCEAQNKVAAAYLEKARANGKTLQPTSTPACTDPGPLEAKPLEAAGAHSPPQTAASPPSTTQPAAPAGAKP
ncbi:hypothetical protein QTH91_10065 [Variovorax dokdonensis]|uniref:Uncharacterized protein n=1 Tax=Variovorax dokdonensis TaxID=344883 RepID=A0ABT7NA65_9BURK|nr:hypothetical protein [Variovorax dokdonensis]MDM0044828.1 hypothetical protein [Variovorax dokdonensis]